MRRIIELIIGLLLIAIVLPWFWSGANAFIPNFILNWSGVVYGWLVSAANWIGNLF
ncbi:hypothetical protein FACS189421_09400 [Bacteroidia bacterium]|nr:hypothetical protein FACS189421_09400 [Bacteroidia bacterium]